MVLMTFISARNAFCTEGSLFTLMSLRVSKMSTTVFWYWAGVAPSGDTCKSSRRMRVLSFLMLSLASCSNPSSLVLNT